MRMRRTWAAMMVAATIGTVTGGAGTPAVAAPVEDDPALSQQLDRDQDVASGQAVLSTGHTDIGPRWTGDGWELAVHDGTGSTKVWRDPDEVVLQVTDAALQEVPDSDRYGFLGEARGQQVWVIPQTQNPDVIWAGWNTQDPQVMEQVNLGATLSLRGVTGPGELVVFLQSGTLGEPEPLWSSNDPMPQEFFVRTNTHTHANWVFSRPGVYLADVGISGVLLDGREVFDSAVLRFAVGDTTDPVTAFDAVADPITTAPGGGATAEEPVNSDSGGGSTTTVIVAVAALAVTLVGGWLLWNSRRQRRWRDEAEASAASEHRS